MPFTPTTPECCGRFECKVLKGFQSGEIDFEEAIRFIREALVLLAGGDADGVREFH
ncbi:MAG: hypothetical protein M2R45_04874 [Verrucomicrobia subdivision 3 bacterium]|nr:hypothetical protein [Limisphaerales bacterium]MCS1417520.1 hypothetical protein [Limisphaerales bacterium]